MWVYQGPWEFSSAAPGSTHLGAREQDLVMVKPSALRPGAVARNSVATGFGFMAQIPKGGVSEALGLNLRPAVNRQEFFPQIPERPGSSPDPRCATPLPPRALGRFPGGGEVEHIRQPPLSL